MPTSQEQVAITLLPDMGSALDAKVALIEKARRWRSLRQPFMGTSKQQRDHDMEENQVRFELANAAMLWLWHEENPSSL